MRADRVLLEDIVSAANAIADFVAGLNESHFLGSRLLMSAVVYQLVVIGEAANRLTPELRQRYPDVRWRGAIDQRNVVAHGYFALDWPAVWVTATIHVPVLRDQIATILHAEFSDRPWDSTSIQ